MGLSYKGYKCRACGHVQSIQTNHKGSCIDYCKQCSWKMGYCGEKLSIPFGGHMYRPFDCIEN
jgi:hypothetical protein